MEPVILKRVHYNIAPIEFYELVLYIVISPLNLIKVVGKSGRTMTDHHNIGKMKFI
jgi:hypothetical protein